jgi:hypothetical protein
VFFSLLFNIKPCRLICKTIKEYFLEDQLLDYQEIEMYNKLFLFALTLILFFTFMVQLPFAQEPGDEGSIIIEEEIEGELKTELPKKETQPQFITSDVLIPEYLEPVINYYIRGDIDRKYSGLIVNLKLEKIYGIQQDAKTATVYFDYSYSSIRNKDNVLYEKGKMTFIKFNSGKWFNVELSVFIMDSYPTGTPEEQ